MSWPNTLIIKRHGQSERNVRREEAKRKGPDSSWADGVRDQDSPLSELGMQQNIEVAKYLYKNYENIITKIFVSPFKRTMQGMEIICKETGTPSYYVEKTELIREIDFGMIDGLTPKQVEDHYPLEAARRTREGKYYYRPPGGENRPDLHLRIGKFLDKIERKCNPDDTVLVECHSVVVLSIRHILEGWDEEKHLLEDTKDIWNAGLTTYEGDGSYLSLKSFNEVVYSVTPTR